MDEQIRSSTHPSLDKLNMRYTKAVDMIERWISKRLKHVDPPQPEMRGKLQIYSFPKDEDTFFLLKMIQIVSGLRAAKTLIDNQFVYEWNLLSRSILEVIEDVTCILAIQAKPSLGTKTFEQILRSFFVEDIDNQGDPSNERIKAPSREQIRRAIREHTSGGSDFTEASTVLYRMGSSVLHGRYSGIMQMYSQELFQFRSTNVGGIEGVSISFDRHLNLTAMTLKTFAVVVGKWFGPVPYRRFVERAERLEKEVQGSQNILYSAEVRKAMEDYEQR